MIDADLRSYCRSEVDGPVVPNQQIIRCGSCDQLCECSDHVSVMQSRTGSTALPIKTTSYFACNCGPATPLEYRTIERRPCLTSVFGNIVWTEDVAGSNAAGINKHSIVARCPLLYVRSSSFGICTADTMVSSANNIAFIGMVDPRLRATEGRN
jgi:hypothetical protein